MCVGEGGPWGQPGGLRQQAGCGSPHCPLITPSSPFLSSQAPSPGDCLQSHLQPRNDEGPSPPARHGGGRWTRLTIQGVDRWTRLTFQGAGTAGLGTTIPRVRAAGLGSPFGGGRARPPPQLQHSTCMSQLSFTQPGGRHHHPPFTAEATWVPNCVAGPRALPGWFHGETGARGHPLSGPPWGRQAETLPFATSLELYTLRSLPTRAVSWRRSRDLSSQA